MEPKEPEGKLSDPRSWTTTPENVADESLTEPQLAPAQDEAAAKRRARRQAILAAAVTPQGSGSRGWQDAYRTPQTSIDWRLWLNKSEVELLRACLLSMNINPTDARWWTGVNGEEHFESDRITDADTSREFDTRFELLVDHRKDPVHFTQPASPDGLNTLRLGEFAAWLEHLGFNMPAELAKLARRPEAQSPKSVVPAQTKQLSGATAIEPVNGNRWNETELRKLSAYREKHGTEEAAQKFKISGARVRALLPKEKPQPTAHNPFGSGRRK